MCGETWYCNVVCDGKPDVQKLSTVACRLSNFAGFSLLSVKCSNTWNNAKQLPHSLSGERFTSRQSGGKKKEKRRISEKY